MCVRRAATPRMHFLRESFFDTPPNGPADPHATTHDRRTPTLRLRTPLTPSSHMGVGCQGAHSRAHSPQPPARAGHTPSATKGHEPPPSRRRASTRTRSVAPRTSSRLRVDHVASSSIFFLRFFPSVVLANTAAVSQRKRAINHVVSFLEARARASSADRILTSFEATPEHRRHDQVAYGATVSSCVGEGRLGRQAAAEGRPLPNIRGLRLASASVATPTARNLHVHVLTGWYKSWRATLDSACVMRTMVIGEGVGWR